MRLPDNYYHCFMGNGVDAVLVGYTGSMVPDKVSIDRCNWYKSNRYYPEHKLVMTAGRWPIDKPLEHAEGSGWYDVAPLGRTWYAVLDGAQHLELQASHQHFEPKDGTLYTEVDYGTVRGKVETWMHATRSILVERYTFESEVDFEAWMGPGVWFEEGWDTDPFLSVDMDAERPFGRYDLGETQGTLEMRLEPAPAAYGSDGNDRSARTRGAVITKYFSIRDNAPGLADTQTLDEALALGYDGLRAEHVAFWDRYFAVSSVTIPDAQYQHAYDATLYHIKAMQSPVSGGLPVNNLRRTWSSHIFWDSYYLHRALLEANHMAEALEGSRFFQRTLDHAERHAREEFDGGVGLKWDWEITHDGRKAYGTLLHMKFQVHNNASYVNEIIGYYDYAQDLDYLREFYPILEGIARFYRACIVEKTERGYEIGYLVGVHESPVKVKNDGINLAGTIVILRQFVRASRILGVPETDFIRECDAIASEMLKTMGLLYNGRYFMASEDHDQLNMSSIGPIYPMGVIDPRDERAISTVSTYLDKHMKIVSGDNRVDQSAGWTHSSPWAAGVIGTMLARQREGDKAWQVLESSRQHLCNFGGMTEVMENGEWNMQYFGTAEAAVITVIHNMLLQTSGDSIDVMPALPSQWEQAAFSNLRAAGFTVSADWTRAGGINLTVRNAASVPLQRTLRYRDHEAALDLQPGEERHMVWPL